MSTAKTQTPASERRRTDMIEGTAISLSALCLVHCLALPMLILLLPGILGLMAQSEAFHFIALLLIVPAAALAFRFGYRRHRAILPAASGVGGIVLLIVAVLPGVGHGAETAITVAGSLLLVAGHVLNWRLRGRVAC